MLTSAAVPNAMMIHVVQSVSAARVLSKFPKLSESAGATTAACVAGVAVRILVAGDGCFIGSNFIRYLLADYKQASGIVAGSRSAAKCVVFRLRPTYDRSPCRIRRSNFLTGAGRRSLQTTTGKKRSRSKRADSHQQMSTNQRSRRILRPVPTPPFCGKRRDHRGGVDRVLQGAVA